MGGALPRIGSCAGQTIACPAVMRIPDAVVAPVAALIHAHALAAAAPTRTP